MDLCSQLLTVCRLCRQLWSLFIVVIQILLSRDANMRIENVVILRYHLMPMLSYRRTIFDCLLTWRENWLLKLLIHTVLLLLLILLLFA